MPNNTIKLTAFALATCTSLTFATPAHAGGVEDLKKHIEDAEKLWDDAKAIEKDFESLSASVKAKLKAKKQRLKNAAKSFVLVGNALRKGRPIPVYITKPGGQDISCGDKIYLHNAAQDKVLRSEHAKSGKPLFVAVNIRWNGKNTLSSANIRVECRDKADGKPLGYGDAFSLKVDPDKNRSDGKNLDDGKPYFHAGTKVGYDPVVRLGDKAEIEKWKAYWFFRGGEGTVQTGIPMEIVATNRKDDGNVGGFCGAGPKGVLPVVRWNMSNHCGHIELAAAMFSEGVARPPQWTKDLVKEVKSLAEELRKEIAAAGGSGSKPPSKTAGTTTPKVPSIFD